MRLKQKRQLYIRPSEQVYYAEEGRPIEIWKVNSEDACSSQSFLKKNKNRLINEVPYQEKTEVNELNI